MAASNDLTLPIPNAYETNTLCQMLPQFEMFHGIMSTDTSDSHGRVPVICIKHNMCAWKSRTVEMVTGISWWHTQNYSAKQF